MCIFCITFLKTNCTLPEREIDEFSMKPLTSMEIKDGRPAHSSHMHKTEGWLRDAHSNSYTPLETTKTTIPLIWTSRSLRRLTPTGFKAVFHQLCIKHNYFLLCSLFLYFSHEQERHPQQGLYITRSASARPGWYAHRCLVCLGRSLDTNLDPQSVAIACTTIWPRTPIFLCIKNLFIQDTGSSFPVFL